MSSPDHRPNLLVIIADQWRGSALGCLGQDPVVTPNLDRLARSGRLLTEAVSSYPVCSPCRAMLLSGAYPWNNGVWLNTNSETAPLGVGLRAELECWSDLLSDEGYELGWVGKWHLDPPDEIDAQFAEGRRDGDGDGKVWDHWTPPHRRHGFSFWYAYGACDRHLTPHYWTSDAAQTAPTRIHEWSPKHEADIVSGFLKDAAAPSHDRRPFGLVWSINPPHQPFDEVPAEYRPLTDSLTNDELLVRPNVPDAIRHEAAVIARDYFAAIHGVDGQIGRVLATLEETGQRDNTLVIFTSDHGMQLGSHGLLYKNVPYEESMRVPMIWCWPRHIPPGLDDVLMGSVDFAPTLLSMLGIRKHPAHMVGHDLSTRMTGGNDTGPDATVYMRMAGPADPTEVRGLRTRRNKLVVSVSPDKPPTRHLWDRSDDPYELLDIADQRPAEASALLDKLTGLLVSQGDPVPTTTWTAPWPPGAIQQLGLG